MALQLREFGKKVFNEVVQEPKNVVISPLCIFTALGMLSFGAKGNTQDEIVKALHFDKAADISTQTEALQNAFKKAIDSQVLSLANNTFVKASVNLNPQFVADLKKSYASEVTSKPFLFSNKQESADFINAWVEQKTHNKIKNLINPAILSEATLLALVSAVYFKANWEISFDTKETRKAEFKVGSGKTSQVQMMHKFNNQIHYGENEKAKWVRIPYKPQGKEFNAVLVLPQRDGKLLEDVVPLLFSADAKLELPTKQQKVQTVAIPKFKMEFSTELIPLLQKIGIQSAFTSDADFSNIADGPLSVTNVIHKAMIEVDEVGTEAAAATAIVMSRSAVISAPKPITFIANQPFFFLLEHVPSKSIIFTAKVHDPSA